MDAIDVGSRPALIPPEGRPVNPCDVRDLKALLARHGFRFSKSMGQNFLIADWVPREIAAASGADRGCGVLEIGPGAGPLTRELSLRAGKVAAVELDRGLLPLLAETLKGCANVNVICGDILKTDLHALVEREFSGLRPMACANLPYNITTPVLTRLMESRLFPVITVMVQREVARRICAPAGSGDCGWFSLYCQYYADCRVLFDVPPDCFLPAPKVTSAVMRLELRAAPAVEVEDEELFFRVIRAAFALRRKTLVNSLAAGLGGALTKEELAEAVAACALPPAVRGEALTLEDFRALSRELGRLLG